MFEPRIAAAICCGLVCHEYYCKRERVGIRGLKRVKTTTIYTYSKFVAGIEIDIGGRINKSIH